MPARPRTEETSARGPAPASVVTEYLTAYLSADISKASSMVREDFSFRAPLVENTADKAIFFAGSERKAAYVRGFRILRQWQDGDDVSTLYELDIRTREGEASLLMHEWHKLAAGQIASTVMLFDTAAPGARLLHQALGAAP